MLVGLSAARPKFGHKLTASVATATNKRRIDLADFHVFILIQSIEKISAPPGVLGANPSGAANCDLHLPEGKPVEIHLTLGAHNPRESNPNQGHGGPATNR